MPITPPERIKFLCARERKSQLRARFTGEVPAAVKVDEFTDTRKMRPNAHGIWVSKRKYSSLDKTLIFLKADGSEDSRASYNVDGDLIVNPPAFAANFISLDIEERTDGVYITWTLDEEVGVGTYLLQKGASESGPFNTIATVPSNGLQSYAALDSSYSGAAFYIVIAKAAVPGPADITSDVELLQLT